MGYVSLIGDIFKEMELHDAIKRIVDQFGKEVLTEERFVNILADVYPDRDNPALFGIIKTMVKDGYCSDLLACDKDGVQTFISKSTLALNKKKGYEKTLVEDILNSLAAGCGMAATKNLNQPVSAPVPSKKTSQIPAKPQTQAPTKPATQQKPAKQTTQKKKQQISSKPSSGNNPKVAFADIGYIFLAFIGLALSTLFYAHYLDGNWWLFGALLASAVVYFITIVPSAIHFEENGTDNCYGAWSAVVTMAAFVTFSTLFIYSFDGFMRYYGFHESDFTFLSFVLVLIICFVLSSLLFIRQSHKKTKIMNKGFYICMSLLLLIYQFIFFMPFYHETYLNCRNNIVSYSRYTEEIDLSFQKVKIGEVTSECVYGGLNRRGYSNIKVSYKSNHLLVKKHDLNEYVDSVISFASRWNDRLVNVSLYSYNDTIHAVQIFIEHSSPDNILSIYRSKYGEPEIDEPIFFWDFPYEILYYWNYSNGIIQIRTDHSSYDYYTRNITTLVLYIDNRFEELYIQKEAMMKERELIIQREKMEVEKRAKEEQRKKDSIENVKKLEQEKKNEIIRKKAIEEI